MPQILNPITLETKRFLPTGKLPVRIVEFSLGILEFLARYSLSHIVIGTNV